MGRILYAWELGGNLGHVGPFMPLAQRLRACGHDMLLAVRDTSACARLLLADWSWVQAPGYLRRNLQGAPLNYAGILSGVGYHDPQVLLGLVNAWRTLISLHGAQLLIVDHAPTAMLAARSLDVPVMLFCSGFYAPPAEDPLPAMRFWQRVPVEQLRRADNAVLAVINEVLQKLGRPALGRLCELFEVAEKRLLTWPELDHYAQRRGGRYWGGIVQSAGHAWPGWPVGKGPRIYSYLRADHPHYRAALQALADSGLPVLGYFPDLPQGAHLPANVRASREPLDLDRACREADVAVLYGGAATLQAFLLAGKPVLALPAQLEQYLGALRVEQMGAGLLESPEQSPVDIAGKLRRLVSEPAFTEAASAFARRHAGAGDVVEAMSLRVEALLGQVA